MVPQVRVVACVQDCRTIRVSVGERAPNKVVVRGRPGHGVRAIRDEVLHATDREKLADDAGSSGKLHVAGFRGRESITSRRRKIS